jgi:uroporphyrinogen decarboxylase
VNSRERVLTALQRREPDRVPYCEVHVDRPLASRLLGWGDAPTAAVDFEANEFTIDEQKEVARFLGKDNLVYSMRAPVFADKPVGPDGRVFYGHGHIHAEADLDQVILKDPSKDSLFEEAAAFVDRKDDYSGWFVTRIGIFSTMLSMGIEGFSMALYDNMPFVERLLDRYVDWVEAVAERVCRMGFDVFASTDDFAFKTAPFFSPKFFHEVVLPRYLRAARHITLPWVLHSDGNIMPILDDLISAGICAAHPMEVGAMDIRQVKRDYGDRLCVLGNVDLNLLGLGTPDEVDAEVKSLVRDVAPGGGYILSSGNSLTSYCRPENVLAMTAAVQKYGRYPISV